jgi:hypothetical protein
MKTFALGILVFLSLSSNASTGNIESKDFLEEFILSTLYLHEIKSDTSVLNMYIIQQGAIPPVNEFNDVLQKINEDYLKVKSILTNNEMAADLLSDYYAFWIASMQKINPEQEESENDYEDRVKKDGKILLEMSERIRAEMQLQ